MIPLYYLKREAQHLTAEGVKELQQRLEELKQTRTKIADEMRDIASQGSSVLEDSANAINYSRAIEVDSQIYNLEHIIATAKVVEKPTSRDQVQIGSKIVVDINGAKRNYTIVGSIEADPTMGKLSDESPLGQSLLGKKVRDQFEITSPSQQRILATILEII